MKKFINVKSVSAIILCFILAFALCACQNAEPSSSSDDATSTISSPSSSINDETDTDTTVDNSSGEEISSETTIDTPSKDNQPPATSSGTNTETSKVESTVTSSIPVTSTTPSTSETTSSSSSSYGELIIEKWRDDELIIGKWHGEYDIAPMLSEMGYGTITGPVTVSCDIEFTADGKLYETLDRASAETAYRNVFTQYFNNSVAEEGVTQEEFEATLGFTREEYVDTMVDLAMKSIPKTITNTYKFEIFTLYIRSEGGTEFVRTGHYFTGENTLTITEEGVAITYTRIS